MYVVDGDNCVDFILTARYPKIICVASTDGLRSLKQETIV